MKDIDLAVRSSKRIESALVRIFGAKGKGLHEKLSSVERRLNPTLVKRVRYVATIRNKLIHEDSYRKIDDRAAFKRAVKHICKELSKMEKTGISWPMIAMIIVVLAVFGTLAAMFLRLI